MKLTGRQRQFIGKFLDLYQQVHHPLPYAAIADYLGVSPMTAYDMLRILEEKGLVVSEYILPEGGGRGRSNIVFLPTPKSLALMSEILGENWDQEEWESVKRRILASLRERKEEDYQAMLDEVLLRIPASKSHMAYVADMMTAVFIELHLLREQTKASGLGDSLQALGLPKDAWLNAMEGLAIGLSFVERANRSVTSRLLLYCHKYQDHVSKLSEKDKTELSDFAQEAMSIMDVKP
jgi:DNA-binding Lrp family transcriptional regulator